MKTRNEDFDLNYDSDEDLGLSEEELSDLWETGPDLEGIFEGPREYTAPSGPNGDPLPPTGAMVVGNQEAKVLKTNFTMKASASRTYH